MELSGYRRAAEEFSGTASSILRQFMFAGIAIIWIFKVSEGDKISIPNFLYYPLLFFVISMIIDLSQYIIGYLIWNNFHKQQEKKGLKEDDIVLDTKNRSKLINVLFWLKILFAFVGYILLTIHLIKAL